MKTRGILTILVILIVHLIEAQSIVILKNGTKIECRKVKLNGEMIMIKPWKGKKMELKAELVDRKINPLSKKIFYLRRCENCANGAATQKGQAYIASGINIKPSANYVFLEVDLEGNARLFFRKEYIGNYSSIGMPSSGMGSFSERTYSFGFLERDTLFAQIYESGSKSNGIAKRREIISFLEKAFYDDSVVMDRISKPNFFGSYPSLKRIFSDYNLRTFRVDTAQNTGISQITFLRGKGDQISQPVSISINDSLVVEGLMPNGVITIPVPSNVQLKVCFNDYCEIFETNPYFERVIDVKYKGKNVGYKLIELYGDYANETKDFLILLEENRKRRAEKKKKK